MWGGTPGRNMVSSMKGLPADWDIATKRNVKWVAALGSETYGNPVVADGQVYVGTNNAAPRDPRQVGDRGVLMAFRETDGQLLWQHVNAKLAAGRAQDWPLQGVCSSPLVEGDRSYYVSNRGELVCLDTKGFRDGVNDGPYKSEPFTGAADADVVWTFDMIAGVGSRPHNMANSSPVSLGDLVYVGTSNGRNESHSAVPSPNAPSIVAIDKRSGKLVWQDASAGDRILDGQWSSPAAGKIGGVNQVVMGQGDGWVRGYDAGTGKKLWELDTNPEGSIWPATKNDVIATPVIVGDRVFIANGQDPERGSGAGHLYAIDATKRGNLTKTGVLWRFDKIDRSLSTVAVHDGLVYAADLAGFLRCLDAASGQEYWVHDMFASVWGSPIVVDNKVYLGDQDGDIAILRAGRVKGLLAEINMGAAVNSTPVPAHGVLYIATRTQLVAVAAVAALASPGTSTPKTPTPGP